MATPTDALNALVAHPDFGNLSNEEKFLLINKVRGTAEQPELSNFAEKLRSHGKMPPITTGPMPRSIPLPSRDEAVDFARPLVSGAVGDLAGGSALAAIPVTGGLSTLAAPAAYGGAYTLTDALMQYLKEKKPDSLGGALKEGATQAVTGKIINGLMQRLGAGGKAFLNADQPVIDQVTGRAKSIYDFSPTTSQALKSEGSPFLGSMSKLIENSNLTAKEKALDRSAGAGFSQALKLANTSEFARLDNGQMAFSRDPNKMLELVNKQLPTNVHPFQALKELDGVIADPIKLEKALAVGQTTGTDNVRKTLAGYQFSRMFNTATTDMQGNVTKLDPARLSEFNSPEMQASMKKLYNAPTRSAITQLFSNIANTQDKIDIVPSAKRFWLTRGGIGIGAGLVTGSLTGSAAAGIATTGLYLSANQLGKVLSNPTTARVMVALAGKEPLNMSEQAAGRLISRALQGEVIATINADGSKTPVKINKDGQMVPPDLE